MEYLALVTTAGTKKKKQKEQKRKREANAEQPELLKIQKSAKAHLNKNIKCVCSDFSFSVFNIVYIMCTFLMDEWLAHGFSAMIVLNQSNDVCSPFTTGSNQE